MIYNELVSFMHGIFKGKGKEILDSALKECDIVDPDLVSEKRRKDFAEYMFRNHFNFSAQRNKYLYEELLKRLRLDPTLELGDYEESQILEQKEEKLVLYSLSKFWHQVEKALYKYEIILNLFWLKGIEAELRGVNRDYIVSIIKKSLIQIKLDLNDSYRQLLDELDLSRYLRKPVNKPMFRVRVFDDTYKFTHEESPDKPTYELMVTLHNLKNRIEETIDEMDQLLLQSFDKDFGIRSSGAKDNMLVDQLKSRIVNTAEKAKEEYYKTYRELEKKYSS